MMRQGEFPYLEGPVTVGELEAIGLVLHKISLRFRHETDVSGMDDSPQKEHVLNILNMYKNSVADMEDHIHGRPIGDPIAR